MDIRHKITLYLENYFFKVFSASDGEEALSLYQEHRPDVLFLDINLPHLDGLTLAQRIREKDKNVKIIMLTAHKDEEKLLRAVELKLTKYLLKPVIPKIFKETLNILAKELLAETSTFITLGEDTLWDKKERVLFKKGQEITLTQKEERLLSLLISKRGYCVVGEEIMAIVWENSFEEDISCDSVKRQVSYLRKKLPDIIIQNVYGQGYLLK